MPDSQWRVIDQLNRPFYLEDDDYCLYAREHFAGGYGISDSNQQIFNFKVPMDRRNTNQWIYKEKAIRQFATELQTLRFPEGCCLIPAATSKPTNHPLYDDKLVRTLKILKSTCPHIQILDILDIDQAIPQAHAEDGTRNPDEIFPHLRLHSLPPMEGKYACIVDDVITTGGHFKAMKRLFTENYPNMQFSGIFWARHIFTEDE